MTVQEFLNILEQTLTGEIPAQEVRSNLQYYRDYIQSKKGVKTEAEIMLELGDPRLIARTIIDTYRLNHPNIGNNAYYQKDAYQEANTQYERYTNGSQEEQEQIKSLRKIKFMGWAILIGFLLVLLCILGVVFWLGGVVVSLILRFLFPVILILVGITWLRRQSNK